MRTRKIGLVVVAMVLALDTPAARSAERDQDLGDLSLEQLMSVRIEKVFGASKYEQKVTQAPAAVTIVTADEIESYGQRTLADVLRSVRGLYVSNDSNYSYLGSRGFLRPGDYNSRTLVLVDGHRMNENIYDSASYGREHAVNVDDVDRIEVIRGPSSSIYGSSAFFGVINIVTRRGRQLDGWEVTGDGGSLGTTEGQVRFGRQFKNELELYLSASYFRTDGRSAIYYPELDQRLTSDPRARDNGVAVDSDAEDAWNFLSSVRFRDFSLEGFLVTREKTVPTASFLSAFNTGREKTTDSRGYLDLQYKHEFDPDLRLLGRVAYDSYSYRGDYPADYADPGAPPDIVINKDRALGEWLSTEWQATATIFDRHTLVAGLEYRENLHQKQTNYDDVEPVSFFLDDDHRSRTFGAYVQSELSLRSNLLLNTGLRYDHYFGSFGGTANPRIGLIYNPAPRTTLKALYGQAFRAPNVYERFYYPGPEPLAPEKIRTYELVVEHYFTADYRVGISAYRYNVHDLISQVPQPDGSFYFANIDHYAANGVELEFEGPAVAGVHVRTSYAFQRAYDEGTGEELTSSPRHLAKLNVTFPIYKDRLTSGLELQYNGAVRTLRGATAGDFLLGNFTLAAHRLPGGCELSASVYNIFNERYGYPGAGDHDQDVILQEGRTVRVRVKVRF